MPESLHYMFCCREAFKPCGFEVRGKTEEEVMEHARMHAEHEHGMKEMGKEAEDKIRGAIRSVKTEVDEKL